mmetsp:Transcript_230/g.905  ORF Transcript_230/g.905 Transcript_230/m.905 type:complete len:396 (+) Transcript_230:217-1404(+)
MRRQRRRRLQARHRRPLAAAQDLQRHAEDVRGAARRRPRRRRELLLGLQRGGAEAPHRRRHRPLRAHLQAPPGLLQIQLVARRPEQGGDRDVEVARRRRDVRGRGVRGAGERETQRRVAVDAVGGFPGDHGPRQARDVRQRGEGAAAVAALRVHVHRGPHEGPRGPQRRPRLPRARHRDGPPDDPREERVARAQKDPAPERPRAHHHVGAARRRVPHRRCVPQRRHLHRQVGRAAEHQHRGGGADRGDGAHGEPDPRRDHVQPHPLLQPQGDKARHAAHARAHHQHVPAHPGVRPAEQGRRRRPRQRGGARLRRQVAREQDAGVRHGHGDARRQVRPRGQHPRHGAQVGCRRGQHAAPHRAPRRQRGGGAGAAAGAGHPAEGAQAHQPLRRDDAA